MAIYVGGQKWKLMLNGVSYNMYIPSSVPITNGVRLLSSDGFILKDINNLYITVKESE